MQEKRKVLNAIIKPVYWERRSERGTAHMKSSGEVEGDIGIALLREAPRRAEFDEIDFTLCQKSRAFLLSEPVGHQGATFPRHAAVNIHPSGPLNRPGYFFERKVAHANLSDKRQWRSVIFFGICSIMINPTIARLATHNST